MLNSKFRRWLLRSECRTDRAGRRFILVSVRRALPDSSAAYTVRDGRHEKKEGWSSATFISQADMELLKRALPWQGGWWLSPSPRKAHLTSGQQTHGGRAAAAHRPAVRLLAFPFFWSSWQLFTAQNWGLISVCEATVIINKWTRGEKSSVCFIISSTKSRFAEKFCSQMLNGESLRPIC